MTVKQFTTKKTRLCLTIVKGLNGSYSAFENRVRKDGGNILILHSWCLHWLIESLHMKYLDEGLEAVF